MKNRILFKRFVLRLTSNKHYFATKYCHKIVHLLSRLLWGEMVKVTILPQKEIWPTLFGKWVKVNVLPQNKLPDIFSWQTRKRYHFVTKFIWYSVSGKIVKVKIFQKIPYPNFIPDILCGKKFHHIHWKCSLYTEIVKTQ